MYKIKKVQNHDECIADNESEVIMDEEDDNTKGLSKNYQHRTSTDRSKSKSEKMNNLLYFDDDDDEEEKDSGNKSDSDNGKKLAKKKKAVSEYKKAMNTIGKSAASTNVSGSVNSGYSNPSCVGKKYLDKCIVSESEYNMNDNWHNMHNNVHNHMHFLI